MTRLERLYRLLQTRGPMSGQEIQRELGISQPVMSRLMQEAGPRVCRFGRSVATRYALAREITGLGREVPIFRVDETGTAHRHGVLHFLAGDGYWLEREHGHGQLFSGLPPFVEDMRPQGYMGCEFPTLNPELGLPPRIRDWGDDHQLIALAMRGEDCVGKLIIGEESLNRFLRTQPRSFTKADYPAIARRALAGQPGSSAGGEHPKFAVATETRHLLVKFASGDGSAADRWRDLLVCEHHALQVLREAGIPVPHCEWFDLDGSRYLEVERFDRINRQGRRAVISLYVINCHYLGHDFDNWSKASQRILNEPDLGLDLEHAERMVWLDTFGDLIGNTDRHFGNLCFFTEETRQLLLTLTPVYDMLPMVFAPTEMNLPEREFCPQPPTALNLHLWYDAAKHALRYWSRLCDAEGLSADFRRISASCQATLTELISQRS